MSPAENKALIRRFYEEVWNQGHLDVADEVFADDYVRHDLRPSQALPGPAGQKKVAGDFRAAFPDLVYTIDLMLAEGDLVAVLWTLEGTHTGQWGDQSPTGKHVRFSGVNIFRLAGARVVDLWNNRDNLVAAQQMRAPVYVGS